MNNPGFAIVDGKKMNLLAQSSQTISGLYQATKNAIATGKQVIVVNCEYGVGVPMTPIPVFCIEEAGTLICTASILQIRVSSDDSVAIYNLITDFN